MSKALIDLKPFLWSVFVLFLTQCTREVASDLEESEANRGIVVLARASIDAEKSFDPNHENRYRLTVSQSDATYAIAVLATEELPRTHSTTPKDTSLIASPEAERAARITQVASTIEQSLVSIEGVLDARVHLDVPIFDPLTHALNTHDKLPKPSASVLVRHRGVTPPILAEDIRRLVASSISNLSLENVSVVLVSVPSISAKPERELARLGPIAVAKGSLPIVRLIAAGMLGFVALLAITIVLLVLRLRRPVAPTISPNS